MKPRHQRMTLVLLGTVTLALSSYLVLSAFRENLVFFFTPTQVETGQAPTGHHFRLGGLIETGSYRREPDGITHHFVVTDTAKRVEVKYHGLLPDLFAEGKGVVAQGQLDKAGTFIANQVLAKHDENYMPPEAAYAIKRAKPALQAREPSPAQWPHPTRQP